MLATKLTRYGLLAIALSGLLLLTGVATLADTSPSPTSASGSRSNSLPGDPSKGASVYGQDCASCHGASLEGGIGATLNPIDKMPGVPNSLDPTFIVSIITNGRQPQPGDPKQAVMPFWRGKLTDQEIKDVAAYIIQQNQIGPGGEPLPPDELAKRTILWVAIAIIAMTFVTYLLAQYNRRWIARRAAARRRRQ